MNKRLNPSTKLEDEDFKLPYSVDVFLPPFYEQIIEEKVRSGQEEVGILVIHDALWNMRNGEMTKEELKAELIALIQEGIDSGPGTKVTPAFWKEFKRRCRARSKWLKTQNLGNTLLPKELYQYIQDKIASGKYANATEVVCAALDKLGSCRNSSLLC
jgi:Arc/MetJ-type ribon-helix-helix transcriptional regulator